MTGGGSPWANYSTYTTGADDGPEDQWFPITVAGMEFRATALSRCGSTLAVDVLPNTVAGRTIPAGEAVELTTPEETARVRLTSVTFGLERPTLSFERLG